MAVDPRAAQAGNRGGGKGIPVGAKVKGGLSVVGDIISAFTTVNRFRLAAMLVWFIGVYTTSIVIQSGIGPLPVTDVSSLIGQFYGDAFIGAILVEFIFTTATAPLVTGKSRHPLSIFVLFINMGINSIVTLPLARGFIGSGAWSNINTAIGVFSQTITGARIDIGSGDVVVYTLMLIMAFALAIGFEIFWHMGAKSPQG